MTLIMRNCMYSGEVKQKAFQKLTVIKLPFRSFLGKYDTDLSFISETIIICHISCLSLIVIAYSYLFGYWETNNCKSRLYVAELPLLHITTWMLFLFFIYHQRHVFKINPDGSK